MSFIDRGVRGLLLTEILSGLALTFSYMFKRKATINYPYEKGPLSPRFPRRACAPPLSQRGGALHRLQAVRGDLPGPGPSPSRAEPRDDGSRRTTRYDIDMTKCIYCGMCQEACPGWMPSVEGPKLRVRHRDPRGTFLQQGEAAGERRPLGSADCRQHCSRTHRTVKRPPHQWGFGRLSLGVRTVRQGVPRYRDAVRFNPEAAGAPGHDRPGPGVLPVRLHRHRVGRDGDLGAQPGAFGAVPDPGLLQRGRAVRADGRPSSWR